ncbi:MAG TPA: 4-hydroxy-3-methylbut-2-enyl diphosphate reductase [Ignavibacteriaceae bacterium]|nr:4-hydroxy-3-methylbut-2-enyl diphosphate reductase [Ignavibacteriaceae bacterium]
MKKFDIPDFYRSSIITRIKEKRKTGDPRKKDFIPTLLDFGSIKIYLARHFGFCYGVENAIEIAYKTIEENKGKRIFLLSEMIHNPGVNNDLVEKGVQFLMDTKGNKNYNWDNLTPEDVVIIPAFGTTLEIENELKTKGINPYVYNTTCPFVEKVWNRSTQLGNQDYTIIIHGKHYHEETKATFSHSKELGKSIIVKDIKEAEIIGKKILSEISNEEFLKYFEGKYSPGFDADKDLERIGVVNQTTMLATETEEISEHLKNIMIQKYGADDLKLHFADTRDTLCYATNDNQDAVYGLLEVPVDLAIVIGGYNSSNTSHLAELLERKFKTFYISNAEKIVAKDIVYHFDMHKREEILSSHFIPEKDIVSIALTSGASCPDKIVDEVILKILSFFNKENEVERVLQRL